MRGVVRSDNYVPYGRLSPLFKNAADERCAHGRERPDQQSAVRSNRDDHIARVRGKYEHVGRYLCDLYWLLGSNCGFTHDKKNWKQESRHYPEPTYFQDIRPHNVPLELLERD